MTGSKSLASKTSIRMSWIDVLKGIGIILVVIGHTSKDNFLVDWLYTFHMPLFFALSGYLWSQSNSSNSFSVFFQKKAKTLLWPFILFRILLVLYWIVIESYFRELDLGPIWFLIVLFAAEIVSYLMLNKHKQSLVSSMTVFLVSAVILFVLSNLFQKDSATFSWLLRFIDGFMWYTGGILIGAIYSRIKNTEIKQTLKPLILVGGGILTIAIALLNGNVSMWSNDFGLFPLFLLGGIVGSLTLALFCKWIFPSCRILEFIGQNTVVTLAVHEPIKRVVLKVAEVITSKLGFNISTDYMQSNILISLAIVAVVVVLSTIVVLIFRFIKAKLPENIGNNLMAFVR